MKIIFLIATLVVSIVILWKIKEWLLLEWQVQRNNRAHRHEGHSAHYAGPADRS